MVKCVVRLDIERGLSRHVVFRFVNVSWHEKFFVGLTESLRKIYFSPKVVKEGSAVLLLSVLELEIFSFGSVDFQTNLTPRGSVIFC